VAGGVVERDREASADGAQRLLGAEAQQRLDAQRKWEERVAADHVFHNNETYEEFMAEVDRVFEETHRQFLAGTLPKSKWFAWREANPRPAVPQRAQ